MARSASSEGERYFGACADFARCIFDPVADRASHGCDNARTEPRPFRAGTRYEPDTVILNRQKRLSGADCFQRHPYVADMVAGIEA